MKRQTIIYAVSAVVIAVILMFVAKVTFIVSRDSSRWDEYLRTEHEREIARLTLWLHTKNVLPDSAVVDVIKCDQPHPYTEAGNRFVSFRYRTNALPGNPTTNEMKSLPLDALSSNVISHLARHFSLDPQMLPRPDSPGISYANQDERGRAYMHGPERVMIVFVTDTQKLKCWYMQINE